MGAKLEQSERYRRYTVGPLWHMQTRVSAAAVRQEPRLGEQHGKGPAPWCCRAASLFQALQ